MAVSTVFETDSFRNASLSRGASDLLSLLTIGFTVAYYMALSFSANDIHYILLLHLIRALLLNKSGHGYSTPVD